MKSRYLSLLCMLFLFVSVVSVRAADPLIDLPLGSERAVTTAKVAGLPSMFGGNDYFYSVFRLGKLVAGQRYEATLTYTSGTDIGYGHTWVDGNPFGKDFIHFVGIGSGTGTGPKREAQQKFLFTVHPQSASSVMYLVFRTHKPMPVKFALQRPSGVNNQSKDKHGYYYVTDFDADKNAPFLLKR